jgi:hypothetical protein
MKTPEQIANEVVADLCFSTNRMLNGRLVGEQYFAAQAIARAIAEERARYATIKSALCTSLEALAGVKNSRLRPSGKKVAAAFSGGMAALDKAEHRK